MRALEALGAILAFTAFCGVEYFLALFAANLVGNKKPAAIGEGEGHRARRRASLTHTEVSHPTGPRTGREDL